MTTSTTLGTAVEILESPAGSAFRELFVSRIIEVFTPLMTAKTIRQFRSRMSKAVVDYAPMKTWLTIAIAATVSQSSSTAQGVLNEVNKAVWAALISWAEERLSAKDRKVVLDILRVNNEIGSLWDETPEENKPRLLSAFLDAYWSLQRLDIILTAVVMIAREELYPDNKDVLHWLCLAASLAIKEWHSAVFVNAPVLGARLRRPAAIMSDKEMGKRLGLSA